MAIAALERLQSNLGTVKSKLLDIDGFRFQ
jgi:hypothetical protein